MVKLLHLADVHLGVENYGRVDPTTGMHSRLVDFLDRLDEAIDVALAADVDLVLLAGDVYKSRSPSPTHQREFARRVQRLRDAGVPLVIVIGNHDTSPALGRAHSVEVLSALAVEGVTVAANLDAFTVHTRGGPLQIIAIPWLSRHTLLGDGQHRFASTADLDTLLHARIEQHIAAALASFDRAHPTVLALHGSVEGAVAGIERQLTLGSDPIVPRCLLAQPGIDYVALGHIHKHQVLGDTPPMVYPGSIERVDFAERDDPKGVVLVEVTSGDVQWRFHPLAARPLVAISVDVRVADDPQTAVLNALSRHDLNTAIVRLDVHATMATAPQIKVDALRDTLEERGAFCVAAVTLDIERVQRTRLEQAGQPIEALSPEAALELYFGSRGLSTEEAAELLELAGPILARHRPGGVGG